MKKILLGILLLSAGVIVAAEEEPILKWNEIEVQTINFDKKLFIKDGKILRKGNYEKGKFIEKEECVYIENDMPILELADGKIEKGSWSFGPAKLKLERSMTNR